MEFKGSKTEKNLMEAFQGESMARVKYEYYASQAKKDGYVKVQNIFEETSGNEKEHAKLWFKYLHEGSVPNTIENLIAAAAGEHGEWTDMYARMAKDAREEGFNRIAQQLEGVGAIEKHHEERYLKLLEAVKSGEIFTSEEKVAWKCLNCGHIHYGTKALEVCPVCEHPKAYFEKVIES